jgi:hypothetical protein
MTNFPFVCKLCIIQANLGEELMFRPEDCSLLGLKWIHMIYINSLQLWTPHEKVGVLRAEI